MSTWLDRVRYSKAPPTPLKEVQPAQPLQRCNKPAAPRLRILCLHGYLGSASVLRSQCASLIQAVSPYADLVFVDAPSLATGDYGWWHFRSSYDGWAKSRAYLAAVFATQGPFDGVLGMSQGAVLTSILCGLDEFPFAFAIMFGGFRAQDPMISPVYTRRKRYAIPSLHVYGTSDNIVAPEASAQLARAFTAPTVVVHS